MLVLKTNSGYLSGYSGDGRNGVDAQYSDKPSDALYFPTREDAVDLVMKNGWELYLFRVEPANFNAALAEFVGKAQVLVSDSDRRFSRAAFNTTLSTEFGRRYVRVVKSDDYGSRSAYCFVDTQTGNVLKADGWKRPTKHARGNIYGEDGGLGGVTPYGAAYIRY